jgi:hypothetical protein
LGNDLLGSVGAPIIAVEDGYIEALGWNQYGGWRIGIRTHDMKRYYYYAHLRKDHPFKTGLKEGVNQIWIDVYNIIKLLEKNRMSVEKIEKDFERTVKINNIATD